MSYRNDHDAARARLEILEQEHRVLVEELAHARAQKAAALEYENREIADELARIRGAAAPVTSRPTGRSAWIGLVCGLTLFALNLAMCSQMP